MQAAKQFTPHFGAVIVNKIAPQGQYNHLHLTLTETDYTHFNQFLAHEGLQDNFYNHYAVRGKHTAHPTGPQDKTVPVTLGISATTPHIKVLPGHPEIDDEFTFTENPLRPLPPSGMKYFVGEIQKALTASPPVDASQPDLNTVQSALTQWMEDPAIARVPLIKPVDGDRNEDGFGLEQRNPFLPQGDETPALEPLPKTAPAPASRPVALAEPETETRVRFSGTREEDQAARNNLYDLMNQLLDAGNEGADFTRLNRLSRSSEGKLICGDIDEAYLGITQVDPENDEVWLVYNPGIAPNPFHQEGPQGNAYAYRIRLNPRTKKRLGVRELYRSTTTAHKDYSHRPMKVDKAQLAVTEAAKLLRDEGTTLDDIKRALRIS